MMCLPPDDAGMSDADLFGTACAPLTNWVKQPQCVELPPPSLMDDFESGTCDRMEKDAELVPMKVDAPHLSCSGWTEKKCCKKNCLSQFHGDPDAVEKFQVQLQQMSTGDRRTFFFQILRQMAVDPETGAVCSITQWKFKGCLVCFEAWMTLCDVSKSMVHSLMDAIKAGAVTAPPDGRTLRDIRQKPAAQTVHAWLDWAYHNLAEPLAEGDFQDHDCDAPDVPVADNYCTWILGVGHTPGAADFQPQMQQRWLPHCKPADLYNQYRDQFVSTAELKEPASLAVFYNVYKEWRGVIRIRAANQHAKCDHCVNYKLHRRRASSEADREEIQKCYMEHLKGMWADRAIASQYASQSAWSTAMDGAVPFDKRVLFIALDGMDECKFKVPRHQTLTKQWEQMWRPTLHNTLVIVYGVNESFFLADCNLKKDSNNQCTVLCHWECISALISQQLSLKHYILS